MSFHPFQNFAQVKARVCALSRAEVWEVAVSNPLLNRARRVAHVISQFIERHQLSPVTAISLAARFALGVENINQSPEQRFGCHSAGIKRGLKAGCKAINRGFTSRDLLKNAS